jgi:hypothetical protein
MHAGIETLVRGVDGFAVAPSWTAFNRIRNAHEAWKAID